MIHAIDSMASVQNISDEGNNIFTQTIYVLFCHKAFYHGLVINTRKENYSSSLVNKKNISVYLS